MATKPGPFLRDLGVLCVSAVFGVAASLPLLGGCRQIAALGYFFSPPQVQKAEFKLAEDRVVLLIDLARPDQDNVVFRQTLHDKVVELLRYHNVQTKLVPQEEVFRLRQQNPDFADWSIKKIGQRLGARHVLWVRVDHLQVREAPESPLLAPLARLRLKVIGTDDHGGRLWPGTDERDGRAVERARPPKAAGERALFDEESAKLGRDTAWLVAMPFFDVDLEKKTPWEP